jgi:cobalt/nickel transport system ATP-binding protein
MLISPGERVALLGRNGVGKSTLLRCIMGLQRPSEGLIKIFGSACRSESDFQLIRPRVGLVFEDSDDQLFCPTVIEDVMFGPINLGHTSETARSVAEHTLRQLDLIELKDRVTHELSGGNKRLVALATVLAMNPELLLLDEPTNGLDADAAEQLMRYLEALPQTLVMVSHDSRFIERLSDRALLLEGGRLRDAVVHEHEHSHSHVHPHIHTPDEFSSPALPEHHII